MTDFLHARALPALLLQTGAAHAAPTGPTLLQTVGLWTLGAGVLLAAVGGTSWLSRRLRSEVRRTGAGGGGSDDAAAAQSALGPSELNARHVFRTLQERKIATVEELAAMSPRERQLLFEAVAAKVTPIAGMPVVRSAGEGAAARASRAGTPRQTPAIGSLHCPACGAALTVATDAPRTVTHCDGCGRRVAAKRDGARLTVSVDEP